MSCATPYSVSSLADGPHTLLVRAIDGSDVDQSPAYYAWTVDTVPPSAPVLVTPPNGSVTNNALPIYSGTGDPNVSVTVVVDGTSFLPVTSDASGNWSYTSATSLAEGSHTVKAIASDGAGNTSVDSNTNTFTVDTTAPAAPVVTNPTNGSTTNDSTPAYSGTAEANSTVTVFVDGSSIGTTTANASGNWNKTQLTPLAEGSHTVKARASDGVGNTSVDSNTNTFTVDTTAPAAPVVTNPTNGSTTNDSTPDYSGTAEANSTVTVFVDGSSIGTTTANASGNWNKTQLTTLAEGSHTVKAIASDGVGNTSVDSNTNTFTVDTTAPAAPVVTNPTNGSTTNDSTPAYSGTAEANSTVTVFVDGSSIGTTTANASGNWNKTQLTPLAEGSHTVKARASDGVGNTSVDSNTNTFTVDTTAPAAPVVTNPTNGSTTNDSTPDYSGTAEANSTVTVFVDGSSIGTTTANASGNWNKTQLTTLAEGSHTVKAIASDGVGNTSPDSNTNTFTVDTTAPAAPVVTNPTNGSTTNDSTPAYSGTAEAGIAVTVVVDGLLLGPVTADASGNWSYTSATTLADGPHSVLARASDGAGNTSVDSNTNTFTVDTTAPAAPLMTNPTDGSTTNDSTPDYSGTAEANSTVTVFVDGSSIGTTTANASGNWNKTQLTPLAEGSHTVKARASDGAGNTSVDSSTNTFTVDTTAPAAPVVTNPTNGSTTNDSTPAYSGTAEAGSAVTVVVDGLLLGPVTADASGNWSYTSATPLADGPHSVLARASDGVGNTSLNSNTNTFTVDTTAPAAPVVTSPANGSTTNDSTPTYSGTAEANSTVNVVVDGTSIGTTPADASGIWNFTQPTPLADGSHGVSAKATDAVGNAGAASTIVTFTVNTAVSPPPPPPPPPAYQPSPRLDQLTAKSTKDGSELALTPSFNREQFAYGAETESAEAIVRAVPSIAGSSLLLDGAAWSGESALKLNEGANRFTIRVASPGGAQDYVLTIVRKRAVAECPFVDLDGHWSKSYVCEAYARSIVNGTDSQHFTPDRSVTRVEFAVMLMNAIGASAQQDAVPEAAIAYSDEGELPEWAAQLVREGTAAGLLKGYPDGSFRPGARISRAEMALMLARAAKWQTEEGPTSFKDDAKLPYWARPAIGAAAAHGILLGRDSGRFDPAAPATRAEAATALLRFVQSLQK
ncbi:Ig-like domain-containing protein [Cohnella ginsengisoli]|uniref:Ig-like domain-containing protein n=2 Tax=Cohnella ginsengisoli TaxID=425004 RepID=A0A9X4QMK7_9BACL|nr:Ig-like domain-containing protein [Cohnella ginsengisoli]MDG0792139.1 Ig-like domain-containing protein [Cohnella ginsengisoli]